MGGSCIEPKRNDLTRIINRYPPKKTPRFQRGAAEKTSYRYILFCPTAVSWQLAVGNWQLKVGIWQLAIGIWQLAIGS